MHPAKKGNTWDFGMKMHIGVDDELGLTQSLSTRAANISDVTRAADLLHGDEQRVCGDSGQGVEKRPEHQGREVAWSLRRDPAGGIGTKSIGFLPERPAFRLNETADSQKAA
jgi:transposase, IS5 family